MACTCSSRMTTGCRSRCGNRREIVVVVVVVGISVVVAELDV